MSYPDTVKKVIGTMSRKNEERQHLLNVLDMWNDAIEQGHNPDDVRSFTFEPSMSNLREMRQIGHANWPINSERRIVCKWYNCVIYHDGSKHRLSPLIRKPQ